MTSVDVLVHLPSNYETSPGPAAYEQKSTFGKDSRSSTILPRREIKNTAINDAPFQMIPSSFGQGTKWSFRGRPKSPRTDSTPGPDYVPQSFGSGSKTSTFHIRPPEIRDRHQSPGPGAYQVPSSIGNGHKFSMKARVFPKDGPENAGPGPSSYMPNYDAVLAVKRASVLHQRIDLPDGGTKNQTPGPGRYEVLHKLDGNAISLHGRPKIPDGGERSPGPARYDVPSSFGRDAKKFTIRSRLDPKAESKGAPYLLLKSTIGDGPKATFHARVPERKPEITTGPSYVGPPLGSDSLKFSFGNRRPDMRSKSSMDVPGPGQYQIKSTIGEGRKSTLHGRNDPPRDKDISPGPAQYAPNYMVDKPTRKTEIGRRIQEKLITNSAPYYSAPQADTGLKFTIGRKDYTLVAENK